MTWRGRRAPPPPSFKRSDVPHRVRSASRWCGPLGERRRARPSRVSRETAPLSRVGAQVRRGSKESHERVASSPSYVLWFPQAGALSLVTTRVTAPGAPLHSAQLRFFSGSRDRRSSPVDSDPSSPQGVGRSLPPVPSHLATGVFSGCLRRWTDVGRKAAIPCFATLNPVRARAVVS